MQFSLGAFVGDRKLRVKEFNTQSGESILFEVDGETLPAQNIHLLLIKNGEQEQWGELLAHEERYYPIIHSDEDISSFSIERALELLRGEYSKWVLKNNLSTLEQQIQIWEQLLDLWPNDLTLCCEAIWDILSRNFPSTYLRLIFPDVELGESERGRKKLIYRYIEGGRKKRDVSIGGEAETRLMEAYTPLMQKNLQIIEWFPQKGELLAVVNLRGVRMIMLAHLLGLDPLQQVWPKLFFDGLQLSFRDSESKTNR